MAYTKPAKAARRRAQYGTQAPGHRTDPNHFPGQPTRPTGPMVARVRMARGYGGAGGSHLIRYADQSVTVTSKNFTEINEAELAKLVGDVLTHAFDDGVKKWRRHIRRFEFVDMEGKPLELPPIPDQEVGPGAHAA